jgi:hypothetical protein
MGMSGQAMEKEWRGGGEWRAALMAARGYRPTPSAVVSTTTTLSTGFRPQPSPRRALRTKLGEE